MKTIAIKTLPGLDRHGRDLIGPAVMSLLLLAWGAAAQAQIIVSAGNGLGAPGTMASVTSSLTGGGGRVATVGFDILFDVNLLDINIEANACVISPRLASTHTLTPFLPEPGRLRLGIFDLTFPLSTFEDGDLATCTFQIKATAALGTTPLTMQNLEASDNSVPPVVLPSTPMNGEVTIALVTPTATPTNTPILPTNTPTRTATQTAVPPTATHTAPPTTPPTITPTRTNTVSATATRTGGTPVPFGDGGGGCMIAAQGGASASPLSWLLLPAVVLFWRRRRG